jgi:hypothetical protein
MLTASASGGGLNVQVSALNPTALVLLRNHGGENTQCDGRGAGLGPAVSNSDITVVWSAASSAEGGVHLWADNEEAQTLLQASGYRQLKNVAGLDSGCCELVTHGAVHDNTNPEFRWALA